MNYAELKINDIANGYGVRVSLFVSGCTHRCPNCFNEIAWDFAYGEPFDEAVRQRMVYRNAFDEPEVEGAEPAPLCEVPGPDGSAPKKVAVLMIDGFEESETIQIVDLLRRAHVEASTYRFQEDEFVLGMQNLLVKSDAVFGPEVLEADAVVVPGGRTAGAKLIAREDVLDALRSFDREGKLIGAMCSGTTVAHAAGVLEGKRVTGYTGYGAKLTGATFIEDEVAVWDANVVTSQGPATPYPFAFKLMEALGIDPKPFKNRLLYALVGGK
jgi:4-methyl-5(b-hydroxyethyl)-thiazole monophosphate biosynthesis